MTPRSLRRALVGLLTTSSLVIIGIVGAAPTGAAVTTTVTNGTTIAIPDQGNANPYPSTITASGLGTSISGLTVELTSVDHTCAKDLDVLLVGPDGTKTTLLSDVGEVGVNFDDCNDLKKTVVVSDSGSPFGTSVPSGNPITVRPSDNDAFPHQPDSWSGVGDEFAANNLASFNGKNPNGAWKLYVVDDASTDSGSIAGWKLNITTPNGPPTATNQAIDAFKGTAKAVTLTGTDPDEDALTCLPTTGATAKGTVAGAGCAVTYTAGVRTQGSDSFAFKVSDPAGTQSGIGTVTVSIVNRNPVATNPAVSVPAGSSVAVVLGGTDADPGEALALTCAPALGDTASGKGKVSGSGCNVTYKADPGTSGTDTFGFNVADGFGGLAGGTVTVTIGPASLAGCSDSDTQVQRYVCRVYLDMLGRPAEPAGKAYWVERIGSGQPRYEILNSFSRTSEYRTRVVRRIFTQLLGRDATPTERTSWADQLRTKNPDVLRSSLLGSATFLGRAGGIDGWGPALYQLVLRRPATGPEAAAAKAQVTTGGKTRTQVALALLATPAADTVTVQSVYEAYLRRTPPPNEASFWVGRLQGGAFETRMVVEIVAANEYFNQP
ncbi:MAG TPA: DUF4214 domain-containing protein [Iamia sp.]|jgi:subtilisin-like proprotein convertase family protein|nr:DUF4214 domain-containing protein [Iamia sp.]